ncbi:MAG: hypothetical protein HOM35_23555, partial [Rhodospirillaceae bacterium]|nr:hypothetical protein [Rhodospirillaceae bacterium]
GGTEDLLTELAQVALVADDAATIMETAAEAGDLTAAEAVVLGPGQTATTGISDGQNCPELL